MCLCFRTGTTNFVLCFLFCTFKEFKRLWVCLFFCPGSVICFFTFNLFSYLMCIWGSGEICCQKTSQLYFKSYFLRLHLYFGHWITIPIFWRSSDFFVLHEMTHLWLPCLHHSHTKMSKAEKQQLFTSYITVVVERHLGVQAPNVLEVCGFCSGFLP